MGNDSLRICGGELILAYVHHFANDFILLIFEGRLSGEKKRHKMFSKGMAHPFFFFVKNDLFLKTEIDNLRANLIKI
jgi:hypothetical protein